MGTCGEFLGTLFRITLRVLMHAGKHGLRGRRRGAQGAALVEYDLPAKPEHQMPGIA